VNSWTDVGRKGGLGLFLSLFIIPAMLVASLSKAQAVPLLYQSFCNSLGQTIQASSGAQMFCKGPQSNGLNVMFNPKLRQRMGLPPLWQRGTFQFTHPLGSRFVRIPLRPNWLSASPTASSNIDAANPNEDITPSGFQAFGQSETSIAAQGHNVVEAWNDATGFFSPCGSPNYKDELTGFGYSGDKGATFQDQGGLPNDLCSTWKFSGDPTVETYLGANGNTYFYIVSLFTPQGNSPVTQLAMDACQAIVGDPFLTCTTVPIIVATSEASRSFLDKDFASIDQPRGRLYVSYTDFGAGTGNGDIKLAMCTLEPNPLSPNCVQPQPDPSVPEMPYVVVHASETCENEGAYPAVDKATGDVYVAYEHNWATNITTPACQTEATTVRVTRIQAACLTATSPSTCLGPFATATIPIASMDAAAIPGYNRFPMNDFPRIAVSDLYGTVTVVWNDARYRPSGDILLQSYYLGAGFPTPVQGSPFSGPHPVRVTNNTSPTFNILPALRNPDQNGHLNIIWYDRRNSDADDRSFTDVYAATGVNPKTTITPANFRVTDVGSDWNSVSSDIVPNFGDYTDVYVNVKVGTPTNTGLRVYPAWSDGRLGDPQPFNAHYASQ
jgi:hypothetical protein